MEASRSDHERRVSEESVLEEILIDEGTETPEEKEKESRCDKLWMFFVKWHLPIFFVIILVIGLLAPIPGVKCNEVDMGGICFTLHKNQNDENVSCVYDTLANLNVGLIFLISGLNLKTDDIKKAIYEYRAGLFGIISILFLSPLLSLWMIHWKVSKMDIPEFSIGLALFFAQATTLSSGPIITQQAKGNVALALLLTVVTNILSVVTMPLFVTRFLKVFLEDRDMSANVNISVDPAPIILQLIFLIIIPLIIGKLLRFFKFVVSFMNWAKTFFKLFSSFLIAFIAWMNVSASADDLKTIRAQDVVVLFVIGIAVHILLLAFNFVFTSFPLKLKQKEKRAVVILSSQKTLPVALTVLELLDPSIIGSKGLVTIPIIICHVTQIVFDAFVAAYWATFPLDNDKKPSEDVSEQEEKKDEKDGPSDNKTVPNEENVNGIDKSTALALA